LRSSTTVFHWPISSAEPHATPPAPWLTDALPAGGGSYGRGHGAELATAGLCWNRDPLLHHRGGQRAGDGADVGPAASIVRHALFACGRAKNSATGT